MNKNITPSNMEDASKPATTLGQDFTLFNLTDIDRATLLQTDEEFVPHDWDELKTIIGTPPPPPQRLKDPPLHRETLKSRHLFIQEDIMNSTLTVPFRSATYDLSAFKRYPTQLRRYLAWSRQIKARYGGIVDFVCQERLRWVPSPLGQQQITPLNPIPFANPADYRILRNDWPYATSPDISHLVVWLKTPFKVDDAGHVLPESRKMIQKFVEENFVGKLAESYGDAQDRVLWFKNWGALQSVGALEHFHVFVKGAGEEALRMWTGEGPRVMM